jgi:ferritin-like protein
MAQASQGWHERDDLLSERTQDLHRAIVSLQEELEAVDWYQQRIDATRDPELRRILAHNRDEEKEHAMMLLEWIRRHDVAFARQMKLHTLHAGPIVTEEEDMTRAQGQPDEAAPERAGGSGGRERSECPPAPPDRAEKRGQR